LVGQSLFVQHFLHTLLQQTWPDGHPALLLHQGVQEF